MNLATTKQVVSILGGTKKLGKEIKSDRDLEIVVTAGLPGESVKIV